MDIMLGDLNRHNVNSKIHVSWENNSILELKLFLFTKDGDYMFEKHLKFNKEITRNLVFFVSPPKGFPLLIWCQKCVYGLHI